MRREFERTLRKRAEAAGSHNEGEESTTPLKELEDEFVQQGIALKRALWPSGNMESIEAHTRKKSLEILEASLRIQEQKQRIMEELHAELARMDDPEYISRRGKGERPVTYSETQGLQAQGKSLGIGDLLADREWGIRYFLGQSVPRSICKRYVVDEAKQKLRNLFDEQTGSVLPTSATILAHRQRLDAAINGGGAFGERA